LGLRILSVFENMIADVSPYVTAAVGLLGSLIGGAIAATVNLMVARQARDAAASSWIRDTRRDVYDRFLTTGQELLVAHEARSAVDEAHSDFFEVYGVLQTVAERPVVDAARVYAYRLLELKDRRLGSRNYGAVAQLVRLARHDTIDAMRAELGVDGSARPSDDFNPFQGTEFENQYA
jgi:xanthosine utilization system XapX-like protein